MKIKDKQELHQIFEKLKKDKKENIFNELYNKYSNLIYKIAFSLIKNKENSEDIKQTVMIKIWNMSKENLPEKNEACWLYTITKNETLNYIRKQENTINLDEIYYINNEDKDINEIIDRDSYNKLISKLNPKEQEIISLKILANLSFKEIAKLLNEPIGTIQWRYYKSVYTLKLLLSNLSMFIITITLFITQKLLKNSKKEENLEIKKDNIEQDSEQSLFNKNAIQYQYDTITNEIKENITIYNNTTKYDIQKIDIGFISVAVFFLTTTITFLLIFIKNQQKAKKNVSK